jgi:hypothetical protein
MRFLIEVLSVVAICNLALGQSAQPKNGSPEPSAHLSDFQAIELRRYTIKEGGREHFAQYFESYFPEAFQQLGAIAAVRSSSVRIRPALHGLEVSTPLRLVLW